MKSKTDKTASDELEREKLNLERARIELDFTRCMNDKIRATTERLDKLVDIVKYFNAQQEEERTEINSTYEKIAMTRFARTLNGHEEDIYNAALIQIKRMVGFQHCEIKTVDRKESAPRDHAR